MASNHKITQSKYQRFKNASSFSDLLKSLPSNINDINVKVLIIFFKTIKKNNFLIRPENIQHPKFEILREATETLLPNMNKKEVTNILIIILPLKAIMHDKLTKQIIEKVLKQINYIPFDQVLFIDFMINKYYCKFKLNEDYITLKSNLHKRFLSKIENELKKCTDLKLIIKIVNYCQHNYEIIPSKIVNHLITLLLSTYNQKFSVMDIIAVLIFLSNFQILDKHMKKLLEKMFNLWTQSDMTANQIEKLLLVLVAKNRNQTLNKKCFNDPKFIQKISDSIIKLNNKLISFNVQRLFNELVSF